MTVSTIRSPAMRHPESERAIDLLGQVRSLILAASLLLTAWFAATPGLAQDAGAIAFAENVSSEVVNILEDGTKSQDDKLQAIATLLDEHVDFDLVGKLVLGSHWRDATEEQRQEYLSLFRELVLANISRQLSFYSGQEFEILDAQTLSDRDTMVKTRVEAPSGNVYRVDWRVRHEGDNFSVIDVIGEGISLVVTQRSEVGETVNRRGMDGLLASMREKAEFTVID